MGDSDAAGSLPPGWVSGFDETHQRVFYFNKRTRRSTWTRPTTAAATNGGEWRDSPASASFRSAPGGGGGGGNGGINGGINGGFQGGLQGGPDGELSPHSNSSRSWAGANGTSSFRQQQPPQYASFRSEGTGKPGFVPSRVLWPTQAGRVTLAGPPPPGSTADALLGGSSPYARVNGLDRSFAQQPMRTAAAPPSSAAGALLRAQSSATDSTRSYATATGTVGGGGAGGASPVPSESYRYAGAYGSATTGSSPGNSPAGVGVGAGLGLGAAGFRYSNSGGGAAVYTAHHYAAAAPVEEWMEVYSPEHRRNFFYNRVTRESVWVDPRPGASAAAFRPPTARATSNGSAASSFRGAPSAPRAAPTASPASYGYAASAAAAAAANDSQFVSLEEELASFTRNLLAETRAIARESAILSAAEQSDAAQLLRAAETVAASSSSARGGLGARRRKADQDETQLAPWGDEKPRVLDVQNAMRKVRGGLEYARREVKAHEEAKREAQVTEAEGGYYYLLGVPSNADADTIKKGYRKQMTKWHPDKLSPNDKDKAQEQAHRLNVAYTCLSDPWERYLYDWLGLGRYVTHRATIRAFTTFLISGIDVLKHPRSGWPWPHPKRRKFWISPDLQWLITFKDHVLEPTPEQLAQFKRVRVTDVIDVTGGLSTEVFLRSGSRKRVAHYFSVVTADRTLDLETAETTMSDLMLSRLSLTVADLQKNRGWVARYYDLKATRDAIRAAKQARDRGVPNPQPPPGPKPKTAQPDDDRSVRRGADEEPSEERQQQAPPPNA